MRKRNITLELLEREKSNLETQIANHRHCENEFQIEINISRAVREKLEANLALVNKALSKK